MVCLKYWAAPKSHEAQEKNGHFIIGGDSMMAGYFLFNNLSTNPSKHVGIREFIVFNNCASNLSSISSIFSLVHWTLEMFDGIKRLNIITSWSLRPDLHTNDSNIKVSLDRKYMWCQMHRFPRVGGFINCSRSWLLIIIWESSIIKTLLTTSVDYPLSLFD